MRKIANDEFVFWLEKQLRTRNLGIRAAARLVGVSQTTIAEILQNGRMPNFDTFEALSKAFGVPAQALAVMAGALESTPEYDPMFEELLALYRQMDGEQQDEFMDIARLKVHRRRAGVIKSTEGKD